MLYMYSGEKIQSSEQDGQYGNFIHISFDDVQTCVGNIISGSYTSVWDEPFFNWLKGLHETYGAVFSLYLYNISNLEKVPDTYKDEFFAARKWLKFGLHSDTSSGTYASASYDKGQSDWNTVVEQVIRFAGSPDSIDRIPRLNYFAGTLEALKGMRDADCGALGFLCSDAVRDSYYLDSIQNTYLLTHDHLIDYTNGLLFYRTDFRGDWFKAGFSSNYTYDVPVKGNVYDELTYRMYIPKYADTSKAIIWFCHEWQIYSGTVFNSDKIWVEDACRFAFEYDIPFDFPQNRIDINPTSFQLVE